MRAVRQILLVGFAFAIAGATIAQAQYLKREPAMGALKPGQRVLVDALPKGPDQRGHWR